MNIFSKWKISSISLNKLTKTTVRDVLIAHLTAQKYMNCIYILSRMANRKTLLSALTSKVSIFISNEKYYLISIVMCNEMFRDILISSEI